MAQQTVQLGEGNYTIQRFRGLKAILAMAAMARVAKEVPDLLADAVKTYQRRNTVLITEQMARLPRWEGFTTEDFDVAEKKTGRREIELPAPMTQREQMLVALPALLEQARKEVVRLLAILVIPNGELREADDNDEVEKALDNYRDLLLNEAELDQLADLAIIASEVLSEQLADRKDRLGKLMKGLQKLFRSQSPEANLDEQSIQQTPIPGESTPQTSTEDAPTSSIGSDALTVGTEAQPSTASLGASS